MNDIVIERYKELDEYQDSDKSKPLVAFIFKDGTKKVYRIGNLIRGLKHNGTRPIGIEWYGDSVGYIPSGEDIEWVHKELRYVFDGRLEFENVVKGLLNA